MFSFNWQDTLKNTSFRVCVCVGWIWPWLAIFFTCVKCTQKDTLLFNMPQTCGHARHKNCTTFMDQIEKIWKTIGAYWSKYDESVTRTISYITLSTTTASCFLDSAQQLFNPNQVKAIQSPMGLQGYGISIAREWPDPRNPRAIIGYLNVHREDLKDRHYIRIWMWHDMIWLWPYYDSLLWSFVRLLTWVSQGCSMLDQVVEEDTVKSVDA